MLIANLIDYTCTFFILSYIQTIFNHRYSPSLENSIDFHVFPLTVPWVLHLTARMLKIIIEDDDDDDEISNNIE